MKLCSCLPGLLVALTACAHGPESAPRSPRRGNDSPSSRAPTAQQPPPRSGATAALLARADAAWSKRQSRPALEEAIRLWQEQLAKRPDELAPLLQLTRAYILLADHFLLPMGEREQGVAALESAVRAGERALLLASPELAARVRSGVRAEDAIDVIGPPALAAAYWYAASLARFAVSKDLSTVVLYRDRIGKLFERVITLDEHYFHGAPQRALASFYATAPTVAGGDLEKARAHFERCLALDGGFAATRVLYAELYATKAGNRALFVRLLSEASSADARAPEDVGPEQQLEQARARRLLAQVGELF